MTRSPQQAATNPLVRFELKKAAAKGYEHGSKIQAKARERLAADGAFKVKDPLVFEGTFRRQKRARDPSYTGPIKKIDKTRGDPSTPGFKGGT